MENYVHPDLLVCDVGSNGKGVICGKGSSSSSAVENSEAGQSPVFREGDELLSVSPIAMQIDNGDGDKICSGCLQCNRILMRCSQCKSIFFCSIKCQQRTWKTVHGAECLLLKHDDEMSAILQRNVADIPVVNARSGRMAATILAQICSEGDSPDFLSWDGKSINKPSSLPLGLIYSSNGKAKTFSTLSVLRLMWNAFESESGPAKSDRPDEFYHVACIVWNALSKADVSICATKHVARRCTQIEKLLVPRVFSNIFAVHNSESHEVGAAVYPFLHIFNHSCYPNAVSAFHGSQDHVRAYRPIYEGEEITTTYTDIKLPLQQRIDSLSSGWGFHCQCWLCHKESPFKEAYNRTKLDPLCCKCVEALSINEVYLLEWKQFCGSLLLPPYPFSMEWFENIFDALTMKRRSTSGYPVSLGFSSSFVSAEDLHFVSVSLPSSIKSLLSNPPVMVKCFYNQRRCRRCRLLESDGYYDRLSQALDASSITNLAPVLNVVLGLTPGLQLGWPDLLRRTPILPFLSLLSRSSQDQQRRSFPPELKQFLSCSLVYSVRTTFRRLPDRRSSELDAFLPFINIFYLMNESPRIFSSLGLALVDLGLMLYMAFRDSPFGQNPDIEMLSAAAACLKLSLEYLDAAVDTQKDDIQNAKIILQKIDDVVLRSAGRS